MKTELIDKGQLSSELIIVLEKSDYLDKYKSELKKYKNKAHLKGFRKGKTPLSAIKKMYGQSVLADVINEKLQSGFLIILQITRLTYLVIRYHLNVRRL